MKELCLEKIRLRKRDFNGDFLKNKRNKGWNYVGKGF